MDNGVAMAEDRNQREIATRMGNIDRSLKELVKVFGAMNTNLVAAINMMRPKFDEVPVDENQLALTDKDTNGDDEQDPSVRTKYLR